MLKGTLEQKKYHYIFFKRQHELNNAQDILIMVVTSILVFGIYFIILESLQDRTT